MDLVHPTAKAPNERQSYPWCHPRVHDFLIFFPTDLPASAHTAVGAITVASAAPTGDHVSIRLEINRMSVLDSFVFLLKADEKDAVSGLKKTGEAFEDLKREGQEAAKHSVTGLKVIGKEAGNTELALSKVGEAIKGSMGSFSPMALAGPLLAGVAAGASLTGILENINKELERAQQAEMVGMDVGNYQALESAFETLGVDADGMRDSLIDLNESLGEAAGDATSGKAKAFQALGVSIRDAKGNIKPTEDALLDLAGAMEGMSKQQATFQIKQLGITDNKVIGAMMSGRKELERLIKLRKALGVQSKEDTERAKEFHRATSELNMIMSAMADELTRDVAPALTAVVDAMTAVVMWAKEHKSFLIAFFGVLGGVALPAVTSALWGMATAAWAAIAPFLPFIAIAAALALVIDDLWSYFTGGESVIGDLAAKFPLLKDVLDESADAVKWLKDMFVQFADDPKKAMGDFVQWLHGLWTGMVEDTKSLFTEMLNWVLGIFDRLGNEVSDKLDALKKLASNPLDTLGGMLGFGGGDGKDGKPGAAGADGQQQNIYEDPIESAHRAISMTQVAPVFPSVGAVAAGSTQTNKTSNVNQNIQKIEVNVSNGDPAEVKQGVRDGLDSHIKGVASGYDDGRSH